MIGIGAGRRGSAKIWNSPAAVTTESSRLFVRRREHDPSAMEGAGWGEVRMASGLELLERARRVWLVRTREDDMSDGGVACGLE